MAGGFEKPERRERARDGADGVHQALEAESTAISSRWHVGGEQSFLRGRAYTAAEPSRSATEEHMIRMRGESERRGRKRGEGVAKNGERLSALQAIREMARGQLCEAGETVGDTFDRSEPGWACADGGQKRGEDRSGGFVTPVAEEAGEPNAEHGAVEPGSMIS